MTRHHAAATAATTTAAGAVHVEDLRDEISAALDDLDDLVATVIDLIDTRQSSDDLADTGKSHRRAPSPRTPGNIAALNITALVAATLHHNIAHLTHAMRRAGVCPTEDVPAEPTITQLVWLLRGRVLLTRAPRLLRPVARDLTHVIEQAELLVDATPAGTCPWCDRASLTVWWRHDEIKCGRDRTTGHIHPCECAVALCPDRCHEDPQRNRHRWHRNTWHALANFKTLHRATTKQEDQ